METVCETLGVARSNIAARAANHPEDEALSRIPHVIGNDTIDWFRTGTGPGPILLASLLFNSFAGNKGRDFIKCPLCPGHHF